MALIKNKHGIIVEVTDERKYYLLTENPVAKNDDGTDKLDRQTGKKIVLVKSEHEKTYKDVTAAEEKAYWEEEARKQEAQDEVDEAHEIAKTATSAAMMAAHQASKASMNRNKGGRKTNAQKKAEAEEAEKEKAEAEKKLREAEGDKAKFDALTEDEKEEFAKLNLTAPTE